ncbi:MAG: SPOR domain-containing protein [Ignavibacteriae bacterium]|nr:SPOR domain-containing protein [Ignavibacteriota bacterium]
MKNFNKKNIVVLISLLFVTGCGFWSNFKTYFNTYYNANELFTEAETEAKALRKKMFNFEEEKISNNISKKFDEVIEKTSAIMQYNKDSDYFEDALLMTGKSFYYQQNYSRALRKFAELEIIPESELTLENSLWIGKTYLQLREFKKALTKLDEVKTKAIEEENQEIVEEVFKSKIGYFLYEKNYETATNEIIDFLKTDISDELRAEVLYELGSLYVLLENFQEAEKALILVEDYSPTPETEFKSRFELAKIQKDFGNTEKSLELLNELRDEGKFEDNLDKIDLEIGKINYEIGNVELALDSFTDVDTSFAKSEAGGIAGFYRAEIIENHFHNYDSSLILYKKTMSSTATQEFKDKAKSKTLVLEKYLAFRKEIAKLNKDFQYLTNEERFIKDSLDYVQQLRLDSAKISSEGEQNVRGASRNIKPASSKIIKPLRPKISVDSIHALNSKQYFELANLFFTELNFPDSAYIYYKLSLSEKEENPNQAQTYYAIGSYYLTINEKAKADSMFTLVFEKFPFNRLRNEAAKHINKPLYDFDKDPVEEEYTVAEDMYYKSDYKNALNNLFNIYKNHPNSIYASKSLYTIGYILENNLNMPDSAASIYDTLNTKYKTTDYAKSIQTKLNGHKQVKTGNSNNKKSNNIKVDSAKTNNEVLKNDIEKENKITETVNKIDDELETKILENEIDVINDSVKIINEKIENVKTAIEKRDSTILDNENNSVINSESSVFDLSKIPVVSRDIYKNENSYFIQLSSWKTEAIAESEVQKLRTKKYNAFSAEIFVVELNDTYFRVLVGPYSTFNEAKQIRLKINKY